MRTDTFDSPALLHEIIAIGADRHPDRIAFRCAGEELSYAALASDVAARAGQLVEMGVRPGDRVGVMLPKCLQSAAAVYGVMACGAAYVPLDPGMPAARLVSIVDDCDLRVLITHSVCQRTLVRALADGMSLTNIITVDSTADALGISDLPDTVTLLGLDRSAQRPDAHPRQRACVCANVGTPVWAARR